MIDWSILSNEQREKAKLAIDYIENKLDSRDIDADKILDSIHQLTDFIKLVGKGEKLTPKEETLLRTRRNGLYHEINDELFKQRDSIVKAHHIKWQGEELGDRMESLLHTDEGQLLTNAIITVNTPFVHFIVNQWLKDYSIKPQNESFERGDLYTVGTYGVDRLRDRQEKKAIGHDLNNIYSLGGGLLGAIAGYSRGDTKFSSYAGESIQGVCKSFLKRQRKDSPIKWPAESDQILVRDIKGRPTNYEIEDIDSADPISAIDEVGRNTVEQNEWVDIRGANPYDKHLTPSRTVKNDSLYNQVHKQNVLDALSNLSYREREVIKLRFGMYDDATYTLEEVGNIFGIKGERVRQIEVKAIRKLQAYPIKTWLRDLYENNPVEEANSALRQVDEVKSSSQTLQNGI